MLAVLHGACASTSCASSAARRAYTNARQVAAGSTPRGPRSAAPINACGCAAGSRDDDRPDQLGAVLDVVALGASPWLEIREASPGAFERSVRLRTIAEQYRAEHAGADRRRGRRARPRAPLPRAAAGRRGTPRRGRVDHAPPPRRPRHPAASAAARALAAPFESLLPRAAASRAIAASLTGTGTAP